jgi:colanic acid biosynthesis glycosyl transferase WcaI
MRILYVSQYFPPEIGAPSARVSELAKHWVDAGHEVTVLTGFPNHPTGQLHADYRKKWRRLFYRENWAGVDVVRTWLIPLPNGKPLERIVNYSSFSFFAALRGVFLRKPDVVIATSPQLLVGLSGWLIGKVRRVPLVFEVRDIWPDAIIASGVGAERSLLARILRSISRFLHRVADKIVVVTPAFKVDLIERWGVPAEKIAVVQNGVETDLFSPGTKDPDLVDSLNLRGKFVASYIGTIGLAHGLGTILEVAAQTKHSMPDMVFLIVGEGADKDTLVKEASVKGLENVIFLPQQPRDRVVSLIRASDACLVLLKDAPIFETVIPTKMLEFMACARPVILGVNGQAKSVLEAAAGGIAVAPESAEDVKDALIRLHEAPELVAELGQKGRNYICRHLARSGTAREFLGVLEGVLTGTSR